MKDVTIAEWQEKVHACVLLLPCGRSAHLELGWAAGAGKRTAVIVEERVSDLDLSAFGFGQSAGGNRS